MTIKNDLFTICLSLKQENNRHIQNRISFFLHFKQKNNTLQYEKQNPKSFHSCFFSYIIFM